MINVSTAGLAFLFPINHNLGAKLALTHDAVLCLFTGWAVLNADGGIDGWDFSARGNDTVWQLFKLFHRIRCRLVIPA